MRCVNNMLRTLLEQLVTVVFLWWKVSSPRISEPDVTSCASCVQSPVLEFSSLGPNVVTTVVSEPTLSPCQKYQHLGSPSLSPPSLSLSPSHSPLPFSLECLLCYVSPVDHRLYNVVLWTVFPGTWQNVHMCPKPIFTYLINMYPKSIKIHIKKYREIYL